MASSSSVKDLCKIITAYIAEPALPLPDDVKAAITAYLDKHETYDDAVADRLQEELVSIFDKYVRGNATATGPWMAVLRRIQMALQSPEKVLFWFDACQNILDNTPLDKAVVKETIAAMMNTALLAEKLQDSFDEDLTSNPIIDRLLSIWIDNFYPAHIEGNKSLEHNEQLLREALGQFGRRKPKEFFASLNKLFVKQEHREPLLRFFCAFIQGQPPHLYQILETQLWTSLLQCLQLDTSTTVVSAALTTVIMLLPHMPSDLVPHLPTLFNIYARLLFWEQERSGSIEMASLDAAYTASWAACTYEPDSEDLEIGHLGQYFSVLYGLYPINFMDYIRKPQRHLRHAETSESSSIEVQPTEMRYHSEQFCSIHVLHPNFYTLTIESEKTDFTRWMKCEAAEVVAGCMGLRTTTEADPFAEGALPPITPADAAVLPHSSDQPQRVTSDPALLSTNKVDSWRKAQFSSADSASSDRTPSMMLRRGSQSSQPSNRESGDPRIRHTESPTQLTQSPSHTQLQDMIKSNKTIKSGLHQSLANDSVASLALSHPDSNADRSVKDAMPPSTLPRTSGAIPPTNADAHTQVVQLQRRVLLLENDLSFERFLKQQHMTHIGDLRRRQVVEAATEAETQNLLMTNRNLKNRYEEAKKAEMQVRKESEKSRAMAKKWETDFYNKLKNMREESKKTAAELEERERELSASKEECGKLRVLLCDAEVKELNWKQHVQSIGIHGDELERLRDEVNRLTLSERDFQAKDLERQEAMIKAVETQNRLEEMQMKLTAQEAEVQQTKRLFQSQLAALQEQLSTRQEERSRPGVNSDLAIESSLAGSRAKQAELQKQFDLLQRKYTKLQSSLLDMNASTPAPLNTSTGGDCTDYLSTSASPVMMRATAHGPPTSPDVNPYHVTPPLDPKIGAALTAIPSPSPQGKSQEAAGPSRSPEQRHFGLHSRLRRDGGDKGKDDGGNSSSKPKKEKRSTLRGIRGFV
ncbi:hamartin [Cordyceps fumosorosea ARSEF 2679]|uniref:Hamartin n=1 Tax=Cordyceps fumosorosea (strain ARSEF 2679) TaxID=1081104 RepID=A0A168AMG8_CORFA|nr:hamartin [Cordyceps fumosorosea ARSEF 2679]OAA68943.1 hamartin [Cordyceps fumosorosea ARSEF 2679]